MKVHPTISPTGLVSFTECRLQWYWGGPMGYKPKARSYHLDLGQGVHFALEAYYRSIMNIQRWNPDNGPVPKGPIDLVNVFTMWIDAVLHDHPDMPDSDLKSVVEARTMGISMLENYATHYQSDNLEVLAVEQEVERPLPGTDWNIYVRMDGIVRDPARPRVAYAIEHKTYETFREDYLDLDHQMVAEAWAAQWWLDNFMPEERIECEGTIYNGLRKHVPGPRTKTDSFVRRLVTVNNERIRLFLKRARGMYNQLNNPGGLSVYPEPTPVKCGMCRFKVPCAEYQRGGDYQYLLDHTFTRRPDTHEAKVGKAR